MSDLGGEESKEQLQKMERKRAKALEIVQRSAKVLACLPAHQDDEEIVWAAVSSDPAAIEWASDRLKSDRKIAEFCVSRSGQSLAKLPAGFRSNRDLVLLAVKQDGCALRYAMEALRVDEEIVTTAVNQKGMSLLFADEIWRTNREMVLRAVRNDGRVLLMDELEHFRNDEEVVETAVRECGLALHCASSTLRANWHVVRLAVEQNGCAIVFADSNLQSNVHLVACAIANCTFQRNNDVDSNPRRPSCVGRDLLVGLDKPIRMVIQALEEHERTLGSPIKFDRASDYASIWELRSLHAIWLVGQFFFSRRPVVRKIIEYSSVPIEMRAATELARLSPVFDAFAEKGFGWKEIEGCRAQVVFDETYWLGLRN